MYEGQPLNVDEFTKISYTFWGLAWAASQPPSRSCSFEVLQNQIVMMLLDRNVLLGEMLHIHRCLPARRIVRTK